MVAEERGAIRRRRDDDESTDVAQRGLDNNLFDETAEDALRVKTE